MRTRVINYYKMITFLRGQALGLVRADVLTVTPPMKTSN